jgi:hypothetical protein
MSKQVIKTAVTATNHEETGLDDRSIMKRTPIHNRGSKYPPER